MWGRDSLSLFYIIVVSIVTFGWNGLVRGQDTEILGCGGFIQSQFPLDFNQIEIKLYTKQGNLKLTTESAPTTGYYFMPLDSKGEYIMKISPPEGWTFDPPEYQINFDGVSSDVCREGVDLNFEFKGFSILGKIDTVGHLEGPSDAMLTLTGEDGFFVKTKSKAGGSFSFNSIPPGKFTLRSSLIGATYQQDTFAFEVKEYVKIENKIAVSGYEIKGLVTSDKTGVEGVTLVLLSDTQVKNVQNCQPGKPTGFVLPASGLQQVICHQTSDKTGTFRFKNVTPGKYAVIPVYKGTNIVYNVSPERIDVHLNHHSIELGGFEVDGFTVLGKVKGLAGATISVNGEVRATSGEDGSFSIQKMKQGTYDFEITAAKFQFEKQTIKVIASNPILPDFRPSKYEFCGSIKLVREAVPAKLVLNFQKIDGKKEAHVEIVRSTAGRLCYFLAPGKYTVSVGSQPEKFFVPGTAGIEVPSGTEFAFKEFSGSISGKVKCPLLPTGKCEARILLLSKGTGELFSEQQTEGGLFKFNNLESGEYTLKITGNAFCWKEQGISTKLRNSNVEGIEFVQTGFALRLTSSHSTMVTIASIKNPKKVLEKVQLEKLEGKELCLKEYSGEGYEIVPSGCHIFEQSRYVVKLETSEATNVQLKAISHEFSGIIQTNAPLTGLQVKKNGEHLDTTGTIETSKREGKDKHSYALKVVATPAESVTLTFFSYDFIFEPNSINFVAGGDCQSEVFRVKAQKSHVIKGRLLPPLGGVEVRVDLLGDPDATIYVQTDNQGEYIAGPFIHSQGFVVTPKMSGYTFKPTGDGYSFNALQWAKIQVSVEETLNQVPVTSVLLSLSGPNGYRQNKVTDAKGEMIFGDLHPGTYFLKALLKEFSFEPSAIHIELQEQESKQVKLKAKRESFSMFGRLTSLSGDVMPNLMITAKGLDNCSEYGEEGVSDENGHFRIWSLKSLCRYHVSVAKKDEYAQRVERTIPDQMEIKIGSENVQNVTFVIIQPVKRMDISLRVKTKNVRNLESLRALIYSTKSNSDSPLFSVPFNGVPYIILPPIPKDATPYYIVFESTLSRSNFDYDLPPQINFTANEAYAHFSFDFTVEPKHHEQEIGKSSYLAFSFIILAFLVIVNFEKISGYLKEGIDKYLQSTNAAAASKRKLKAKSQ